MHLTNTQLRRRIEFWQKRLGSLGLQHWRISNVAIVDDPHGEENAVAAVMPSEFYDTASIEFATGSIEEMDARELDETIIHELLHLVFRDLQKHAENTLGTWMPYPTLSEWMRTFNRDIEQIIDRTARAIYAEHTAGA